VKTNYVLIDFENVQPRSLEGLNGDPFKVLLFVGANQSRIVWDKLIYRPPITQP